MSEENIVRDNQGSKIELKIENSGGNDVLVFVPGSFSTSAAWKPIANSLKNRCCKVFTSLRGYGLSEETRSLNDCSISHQIKIVEKISDSISRPFHLIGHSFGACVVIAAAFESRFPIKSIITFEANPPWLLNKERHQHVIDEIQSLSKNLQRAVEGQEINPAKQVIDFYGRKNTFDTYPSKLQKYFNDTAKTNVLDWMSAEKGFGKLGCKGLIESWRGIPAMFVLGEYANEFVSSANVELMKLFENKKQRIVKGAGHFLISTHYEECARIIDEFVFE